MGTFWHQLKSNKTNEQPRNWCYVDTEARIRKLNSTTQEHSLRHGVACYHREGRKDNHAKTNWWVFEKPVEFWWRLLELCELDRRLIVVGYNMGYDLRLLDGFNQLCKLGYEQRSIYVTGQALIIHFHAKKHRIVLIDAMNYFDGKLEKWGEQLNIPKLPEAWDSKNERESLIYCSRDVEILRKCIEQLNTFRIQNDLGHFTFTKASSAFTAFKHRFMTTPIVVHDVEHVIKLEHDSYFGGRVECFHIGKLPCRRVWKLDVNSLYPSVMNRLEVPCRFYCFRRNMPLTQLRRGFKEHCLIADVTLKTDVPAYPYRTPDHTIWPVGEFRAVLASPELRRAVLAGHVVECHVVAIYKKAVLFAEYVRFFYELRKRFEREGNQVYAVLAKYLLNSLYGKFGQYSRKWIKSKPYPGEPQGISKGYRVADKQRTTRYVIEDQAWEVGDITEGPDSFCAIASHVTSAARIVLQNLINTAGRTNVFYCDTDSLFVNQTGRRRLGKYIHPTRLGALKIEEFARFVEIRGPKDYRFGRGQKCKGITAKARVVADNVYEQEQWEGLRGAIGSGRLDTVRVSLIEKHLDRVYSKGVVGVDGSVSPISLDVAG